MMSAYAACVQGVRRQAGARPLRAARSLGVHAGRALARQQWLLDALRSVIVTMYTGMYRLSVCTVVTTRKTNGVFGVLRVLGRTTPCMAMRGARVLCCMARGSTPARHGNSVLVTLLAYGTSPLDIAVYV